MGETVAARAGDGLNSRYAGGQINPVA